MNLKEMLDTIYPISDKWANDKDRAFLAFASDCRNNSCPEPGVVFSGGMVPSQLAISSAMINRSTNGAIMRQILLGALEGFLLISTDEQLAEVFTPAFIESLSNRLRKIRGDEEADKNDGNGK